MSNFMENCWNSGRSWNAGDRNGIISAVAGPSTSSSVATRIPTRRRAPTPYPSSPKRTSLELEDERLWPSLPQPTLTWAYKGNYSHFGDAQFPIFFGLYPLAWEHVAIEEPTSDLEDPMDLMKKSEVKVERRPLYSEVVKRNLGKPVVTKPKKKIPKMVRMFRRHFTSSHIVEELGQELQCAVCYNLLRKPVYAVVPCSHKFCRNCIMKWMHEDSRPVSCPICRVEMREVIHDTSLNNILDIYYRSHRGPRRANCPPLEEEGLLHGPVRLALIPPDDDTLDDALARAVEVRHLLNAPLCLENIIPLYHGLIEMCNELKPIIEKNLERLAEFALFFYTSDSDQADDEYSDGDSEAEDEEDYGDSDEENEAEEEVSSEDNRSDDVYLSLSEGQMGEDELSIEKTSDEED